MVTLLIKLELERIKREVPIQEIADRTGMPYLKVWRKFNGQSPIDINFIEKLENSGLVNLLDIKLDSII